MLEKGSPQKSNLLGEQNTYIDREGMHFLTGHCGIQYLTGGEEERETTTF